MGIATTTSVGCPSPNPSVLGHATYFFATVSPMEQLDITGTIQFKVGGVNYGAPVPVSNIDGWMRADITITDAAVLTLGSKTIAAYYSGDVKYDPSLSVDFAHDVATSACPDTITDLAATVVSSSAINLAWTLPYNGNSAITAIDIEMHNGVAWSLYGTVGLQSFANIVGLTPSTTYIFWVQARNAIGPSWPSNYVTATTLTASAAGGALVNNGKLLLTNGKLVITV